MNAEQRYEMLKKIEAGDSRFVQEAIENGFHLTPDLSMLVTEALKNRYTLIALDLINSINTSDTYSGIVHGAVVYKNPTVLNAILNSPFYEKDLGVLDQALEYAANIPEDGGLESAKILFKHGAPVTYYRSMALLKAFKHKNNGIIKLYIANGFDNLNLISNFATQTNNLELLDYLENLDKIDWDAVLTAGVIKNDIDTVLEALDKGAEKLETGLELAATKGYVDLVKILIKHGARSHAKALHSIIRLEYLPEYKEIAEILIDAGEISQGDINWAIRKSIERGSDILAFLLTNKGADISQLYEDVLRDEEENGGKYTKRFKQKVEKLLASENLGAFKKRKYRELNRYSTLPNIRYDEMWENPIKNPNTDLELLKRLKSHLSNLKQ